jgi:hypothetical protein
LLRLHAEASSSQHPGRKLHTGAVSDEQKCGDASTRPHTVQPSSSLASC